MGFSQQLEYRYLCEEYNLYADLTVRVFAASNDLPELVLPDGSVAFWASAGATVSFDFYLDLQNPPHRSENRTVRGVLYAGMSRVTRSRSAAS